MSLQTIPLKAGHSFPGSGFNPLRLISAWMAAHAARKREREVAKDLLQREPYLLADMGIRVEHSALLVRRTIEVHPAVIASTLPGIGAR